MSSICLMSPPAATLDPHAEAVAKIGNVLRWWELKAEQRPGGRVARSLEKCRGFAQEAIETGDIAEMQLAAEYLATLYIAEGHSDD